MMDDLFKAVQRDDHVTMSRLICYPFDATMHMSAMSPDLYKTIDWQLQCNPTVLCVACFFGSISCFNILIAMGADVNEPDGNGVDFTLIDYQFILLRYQEMSQYFWNLLHIKYRLRRQIKRESVLFLLASTSLCSRCWTTRNC